MNPELRSLRRRYRITKLLHFGLWITPASLIAASLLLSRHISLPTIPLWLSIPLLIVVTITCAILDGLLDPDLPTTEGVPDKDSLIAHTVDFCIVQLAFAPIATLALWGLFSIVLSFT